VSAEVRCRYGGTVRRAWTLLVVAHLLVACAGDRRPPPAAPSLEAPSDALPPELDMVVRIDVGRVRSALGAPALALIRGELKGSDALGRFGLDVLERSDVFVLGLRYEPSSEGYGIADAVIAAEGDFRGLDPRKYSIRPPWQAPIDLGGDIRRYDRGKPDKRGDPARLYLRSNRMMVVVSEAAIDSVEAVVERHAPPNPIRPPERGIASAALRLGRGNSLLGNRARFPMVSEALDATRSVEVWIDQTAKGFEAQAAFELETEAHATRAAEILEVARTTLQDGKGWGGILARHSKVTVSGKHALVDMEMPLSVVGAALGGAVR
jgi:hypothetical protein